MIKVQTLLAFVLVFGTIVLIHELGHFLFAKRAGILVREFAIGFGPKLFSYKKGETQYSIRLLPLGGYVRMAGEDPELVDIKTGKEVALRQNASGQVTHIFLNPAHGRAGDVRGRVMNIDLEQKLFIRLADDDGEETDYAVDRAAQVVDGHRRTMQIAPWDRQFGSKSVGARAATIFAGPLFNIVLAGILYTVLSGVIGIPDHVTLDRVEPGTPAEAAGLKKGDVILTVNGEKIANNRQFVDAIQQTAGGALAVVVKRGDETVHLTVKPTFNEETQLYAIGVAPRQENKPANALTAAQSGVQMLYDNTLLIFKSFQMLLSGQAQFSDLAGPVGIADMTGQIARAGWINLVSWTGLLSLYLGIFNLLPIPALDGSRLMFIAVEGIRGKPVDPKKESMVHLVGFALLLVLMVAVTYNDILRLMS